MFARPPIVSSNNKGSLPNHQVGSRVSWKPPTTTTTTTLLNHLQTTSSSSSRCGYSSTPTLPEFKYTPLPYTGPSRDEVFAMRKQYLSPALFYLYKEPIMIVEGKQQYMFDEKGKRYLDLFGGIVTVSVGHSHPDIVRVAKAQMDKIFHTTTIYLNNEIAEFGKELAEKLPAGLDVIYFVNSGSEANDLAMLMARAYTGAFDYISLRNGYHGMSYSMMGVTALRTWKFPVPQGFGIHQARNPNTYRGPWGADVPNVGQKYAEEVADIINFSTSGQVAGFIAETIQGVGGSVVLPDGYLKAVYEYVRAAGGLCVADEVQCGFGRLGTHYWGFQTHGVTPDIVTMAKGIGNGIPLAAVATTREIANTLSKRIHFNTYGGNPISSAIGREVLKVIDRENLQRNCLERGQQFISGLKKLQQKYDLIGDVRGKGLMLGMELVKNRDTKEPATPETLQVMEYCREMGLLIGKGGMYGNVFRIKPPMCITAADVDFALEVLDRSFAKL